MKGLIDKIYEFLRDKRKRGLVTMKLKSERETEWSPLGTYEVVIEEESDNMYKVEFIDYQLQSSAMIPKWIPKGEVKLLKDSI